MILRSLRTLVLAAACILLLGGDSDAQNYLTPALPKRHALVIANSAYNSLEKVPSASHDGSGVNDLLKKLGFEVTLLKDVKTKDELQYDHLPQFIKKISEGDIIVLYFSGHGFSLNGDNYLSLIESPSSLTQDGVEKYAIALDSLEAVVRDRKPGLIFLILDACRTINNVVGADDTIKNAINKGPAAWRARDTRNTLAMFASQPGTPAIGSVKENTYSQFTASVLAQLIQVDRDLGDLWIDIHWQVLNDTGQKQQPQFINSASVHVVLNPSPVRIREYETIWRATLETKRRDVIDRFSHRHALSQYASAARQWLKDNPSDRDFTRIIEITGPFTKFDGKGTFVSQRITLPFGVNRLQTTTDLNLTGDIRVESKYPNYVAMSKDQNAIKSVEEQLKSTYADELRFLLGKEIILTQEILVSDRLGRTDALVRLPIFTSLRVEGVEIDHTGAHWVRILSPNSQQVRFYKPATTLGEAPFVVGSLLTEIDLRPKGSLPELLDEMPVGAAVAALRREGKNIERVMIIAPKATDAKDVDVIVGRVAHAEYLVASQKIERTRINSTIASNEVSGDVIKVRIFGK
jgi:hypothetical protein